VRGFFRRLGLAGTQDIGEALKVGVPGVEYGDPGVDVDQVTRFDESGQIAPAPLVKTGRDARIASPGVIQAETFDAIAYRLVQLAVGCLAGNHRQERLTFDQVRDLGCFPHDGELRRNLHAEPPDDEFL
jgi:hypothetical protein